MEYGITQQKSVRAASLREAGTVGHRPGKGGQPAQRGQGEAGFR
ncbi:hypothetical protein [Bacteroides finegoldii]|nr:hypothetical protein [Bacteroides finegoldii]